MGVLDGGIVGSALKVGATLFGGASTARDYRRMRDDLAKREKENQDWYERRYNEDPTQRADAQRLLTMTEEAVRNRNKQAAGEAAVMGGTQEAAAAARQANGQMMADVMGQINAASGARRDAVERQYLSRNDYFAAQRNRLAQNKAAETAKAVLGASDAAGNLINNL